MEFMEALPPVVDRIMSLFALAIGFPEDFFKTVRCPCRAFPTTSQCMATADWPLTFAATPLPRMSASDARQQRL